MAVPNPNPWAQSHLRWLALSRWDNEGGASPLRPTSGCAGTPLREGGGPSAGMKEPTNRASVPDGHEESMALTRSTPG